MSSLTETLIFQGEDFPGQALRRVIVYADFSATITRPALSPPRVNLIAANTYCFMINIGAFFVARLIGSHARTIARADVFCNNYKSDTRLPPRLLSTAWWTIATNIRGKQWPAAARWKLQRHRDHSGQVKIATRGCERSLFNCRDCRISRFLYVSFLPFLHLTRG